MPNPLDLKPIKASEQPAVTDNGVCEGKAECTHPVLTCENTTHAGTPAVCRLCGASVIIPPVTWEDRQRRHGITLESHRDKLDYSLALFHARMLIVEPQETRT